MKLGMQDIALWFQPIREKKAIDVEQVLSTRELERYHRFQRPAKRAELLCSRLLLQTIRHHYMPETADSIETVIDEMGRPFWYLKGKKIPLYFSLSHTRDLAACAVSRIPAIGCDIEQIRQRTYEKALAARVFGRQELHHYTKQHDETAARHFFYRSWTLKEAYLKAMGTGLRTPLTEFDFAHTISDAQLISTIPDPKNTTKWRFFHVPLPQGFSLSIATQLATPRLCGTIPLSSPTSCLTETASRHKMTTWAESGSAEADSL